MDSRRPFIGLIGSLVAFTVTTFTSPARADDDHPSRTVYATFDANGQGAALERRAPVRRSTWETLCTAPCQDDLDTDFTYRVTGSGIASSSTFRIPADAGAVRIDAKTGSSAGRTTGIVLAPIGGLMVVFPLALLMMHGISVDGGQHETKPISDGALIAGASVAAVGVVALTAGLILFFSNHTSVKLQRPSGAQLTPRFGAGGFTF